MSTANNLADLVAAQNPTALTTVGIVGVQTVGFTGNWPMVTALDLTNLLPTAVTINNNSLTSFTHGNDNVDCTYTFTSATALAEVSISGNASQTALDLSGLAALTTATITGCDVMSTGLLLPASLTTLTLAGGGWVGAQLDYTLPALTSVTMSGNNSITSVSFASNVLSSISISGCSSITVVNLGTLAAATSVAITGAALVEGSVDGVLSALDANGLSGGSVDLSGGTSSTPSAAGLTAAANLIGKGWTVTTN